MPDHPKVFLEIIGNEQVWQKCHLDETCDNQCS